MATFSKWKRRTPKWEGNELDPEPFAVEVKRLTIDERAAYRERFAAIRDAVGPPPETIGAVLACYVRGPLGTLAFEGVPFVGGIAELVDGMQKSDAVAYHALVGELVRLIGDVNAIGGSAGE